ncbi:MAG: class I SAM-dependent methyltransferase [Saprospiraceae bacterium]|nr:methyltransferase domain-containing protein [Lewinella sp.]
MKTPVVSWDTYARKYDMLIQYNPFYQRLHRQVFDLIKDWQIDNDNTILDLGAGTGNYSIRLAQQFPEAQVIHADKDAGMNEVAHDKMIEKGIENLSILESGVEEMDFPAGSLEAVISIHALYAFPDPVEALQKIHSWLRKGGKALLVDAGRVVNVLDWQLALAWHFLREYGPAKTWQIFREGKEVSRQNAYIRQMQKDGVFWTHSYEEFEQTVRECGFEILDGGITFRGVSDWVLVRKD